MRWMATSIFRSQLLEGCSIDRCALIVFEWIWRVTLAALFELV
jgi:hypothetical protein